MKKAIFMRGISGSGKSTEVRKIVAEDDSFIVCSADHYFYDENGAYNFDGSQIKYAHLACKLRFFDAIMNGRNIIIDNTNLHAQHLMWYVSEVKQFGYELELIEFEKPDVIDESWVARGDKGIGIDVFKRQLSDYKPLSEENLKKFDKRKTVSVFNGN